MNGFVSFDQIRPRLEEVLQASELAHHGLNELWIIRDLTGQVRLLLPETPEPTAEMEKAVHRLARDLHDKLGAHAHDPERAVLTVDAQELMALEGGTIIYEAQSLRVYLVDRLVTGSEWATVSSSVSPKPLRWTLFSLKGGVGRSTTAAVLATHLAQKGYRVLVMDLDLESPGVSSMLLDRDEHSEFGIVDWFVEDLVGQGEEVVPRMVGRPHWGQDFRGEILVAPAYGQQPGEYLAKLGRVYLNGRPEDGAEKNPEPWIKRLLRLLQAVEEHEKPDIVLLDTRSGLHDLAAAAVTDVQAHVLLFAVDSEATWTGYRILFGYWQMCGVAPAIRERLSMVAALVPEMQPMYLKKFRERAWDLFRESLYDEVPADSEEVAGSESFSFDLADEDAPHNPFPIDWNRGLAALPSLRDLDGSALSAAYGRFFEHFDHLLEAQGEEPR